MKKKFIILAIFLSINTIFAQNKGIYLIQEKSKDTIFLQENKRIKIVTTTGQVLRGKFLINDNDSITIKGEHIPIESIIKIRRASLFHAIVDPVSITVGAVFLIAGVTGLIYGGYAAFISIVTIPTGLPMFLVPIINNNHVTERWNYKIKNDNDEKFIN